MSDFQITTAVYHPKRKDGYWTLDRLRIDANQFETRLEFQRQASCAYQAAKSQGVLDEICGHMKLLLHKDWTVEELVEEASKFSTLKEFRNKSRSAYRFAQGNGLIETVCAHMDRSFRGFDPRLPGLLYYLRVRACEGFLYKIGITNQSVSGRFVRGNDMEKIETLATYQFDEGYEARSVELSIKRKFRTLLYKGEKVLAGGGNSELFTENVLEIEDAIGDHPGTLFYTHHTAFKRKNTPTPNQP